MPYFDNLDTYINPYYLDVTPSVRAEMYKRAQYYGSKTRTGINNSLGTGLSNSIEWPYQKMPWAYVTSKTFSKEDGRDLPIVLGFDLSERDGIKTNSDGQGRLTLYDSERNVPNYPLLTHIEISNEGQRGALLKGKFGFTFFPGMLPDGFALEAIQRIFFTPGNRVNIGFGWSTPAYDPKVNKLEFVGIIYGFNWSFNQNTSITAEVQIVAPSTLSLGLSGEQTVLDLKDGDPDVVLDPTGRPLPPKTNIITIITRDLLANRETLNVSATGVAEFLPKENTKSGIFNYFKIGLPTVVGSSFEDAAAGRLIMNDQERAQEQQEIVQQQVEAIVETFQELPPSLAEGIFTDTDGGVTASVPKADGDYRATYWNEQGAGGTQAKPAASFQLREFLRQFVSNNGDTNGEWIAKWKDRFSKSNISRYVLKPDSNGNAPKERVWETRARLDSHKNGNEPGFPLIDDLKLNDFNDFIDKINSKSDLDSKVLFIKRKIAQLAAQELREVKIAAIYKNRSGDNKNAELGRFGSQYCQFFYHDEKTNKVERDKYFWPDNLTICLVDSYSGQQDKVVTMINLWDEFFQKLGTTKSLRDALDGKSSENAKTLLELFESGRTNKTSYVYNGNTLQSPSTELEKRLNEYIDAAQKFALSGQEPVKNKKEGTDAETDDKKPAEKVTPEEKQRLDGEISELKTFQSRISTADVFKTDNNKVRQDFEKDYPPTRFVGGVDVKSIQDNISYDLKGAKNEEIPIRKSAQTSKFVQKLIDAREEQKKTGVDTVKDLIKVKSTAYQERLNNANNQNGGSSDGGADGAGGGSDGTGTGADPSQSQQYQSHLVGQTYWYITLKDLVEFANKMMETFEEGEEAKKYNFQKFRIMCENNETEYQPDVKSAYPQNVYFPDISMGGYQTFNPFYDNEYSDFLRTFEIKKDISPEIQGANIIETGGKKIRIEDDVINIGNILIGINLILKVYREFLIDNATNISYKNITSLFDVIIREINAASGDTYQLVSHLFTEPEKLSPKYTGPQELGNSVIKGMSVLSLEDTHIARKHSQTIKASENLGTDNLTDFELNDDIYSVKPFVFEATIFKPLIKNVQISSKPPKELAFSAYIAARGQESNAKGGDFRAKPYSGDGNVIRPIDRDNKEYEKQYDLNSKDKTKEEDAVATQGFTQEWCDNYRSILTKFKRLTTKPMYQSGRSIGVGGHWLNKAIYPVEFTVTIDGINGFKFGDVLKTTMIPRHYNVDWDMVFTVTKILHKVTPSTWETTLNTSARLSLDSPLTGIQVTANPLPDDKRLPDSRTDVYGPNREEVNRQ